MRKISLMVLVLLLLTAAAGFGQDADSIFGEWKGKVAAPTYGFAAWPINVAGEDGGYDDNIWVPGLDLRIFMGTNVTKRAGFFYGLEVGTMMFFTPEDGVPIDDNWNGVDYTVDMSCSAGMVFALAKYGYRIDLGISALGVSLGAEMGMGARIGNGTLELAVTQDFGGGEEEAERDWEAEGGSMDLVLDGALEAAVRLGRNFRILARVGVLVTPPFLNRDSEQDAWWTNKDTFPKVDGSDAETAVARYVVEPSPVIVTGRLGFALNY
jgi:hypothetical protein